LVLLLSEVAAEGRGIEVVLPLGVTAKSDGKLINQGIWQEKRREAEFRFRQFFRDRRAVGKQGGISEPQSVCVTLKFSEARPYFFPATTRRLKGKMDAA